MNSTVLASLGVRLDQEDLHSELLALVKERKLGREVVTNQFILEIRDHLEVRGRGGIIQGVLFNWPPLKISLDWPPPLIVLSIDCQCRSSG